MNFIKPDWPAPRTVHAYTTTRAAGNLAHHVGDQPESVARHRKRLQESLQLPGEPIWLNQVHGTTVVQTDAIHGELTADAAFTYQPDTVCAVLTADCLPLLICDRQATCVASIHAGWRGLVAGIIENTLNKLTADRKEMLAWLGPAIGPTVFEVGEEVRQQFIATDPQAEKAFSPSPNNRWLADIYLLAKQRLKRCGINAIYGGNYCTYSEEKLFFSYRRDGQTGRMATLIWRNPS